MLLAGLALLVLALGAVLLLVIFDGFHDADDDDHDEEGAPPGQLAGSRLRTLG